VAGACFLDVAKGRAEKAAEWGRNIGLDVIRAGYSSHHSGVDRILSESYIRVPVLAFSGGSNYLNMGVQGVYELRTLLGHCHSQQVF